MLRSKLLTFCLSILLLTACSRTQPTTTPVPTTIAQATLLSTATHTPQPTATQSPTLIPTATRTPPLSATPLLAATSIKPATVTPLSTATKPYTQPPSDIGSQLQWLMENYIINDLNELKDMAVREKWQGERDILQLHDLTGDDQPELIVSLGNPDPDVTPISWFFIVDDQQIFYGTMSKNPPRIESVLDMTGDAVLEIVVGDHSCFVFDCTASYRIFSFDGDGLVDLVEDEFWVPRPDSMVFTDENGDGFIDVVVEWGDVFMEDGTEINEAGLEIWGYDAEIGRITQLR